MPLHCNPYLKHLQKTVPNLERTIKTNFNGNFTFLEKLYPLAKENARIVFVSSIFSIRAMYSLGTAFKILSKGAPGR